MKSTIPIRSPWWVWGAVAALVGLIYGFRHQFDWAFKYPKTWVLPLRHWISDGMAWLINDASLGLFTFKDLTRGLSWLLEWPLLFSRSLLSSGFVHGLGDEAVTLWPRISWLALIVILMLLAIKAGRRGVAWLVGACFLYLAVFGQWESAMVTLSSIVIAVPLGVAAGLSIGIAAYRHPAFEKVVTPLLDLMQTVPVFAYLVPVLVLFGFSPVAAMIATMIYALPPMVRNTVLALRRVPPEIKEFGQMAGCTRRQLMWLVMIPSARSGLLIGVNQVIMMSLNMVIIASMIGAGGLGRDVLAALRRLNFGEGLEASIAITLLAIALDRLSQAYASRGQPVHVAAKSGAWWRRNPFVLMTVAILAFTWLLGLVAPFFVGYPETWQVSTGQTVNDVMKWLNINLYDALEAMKAWLLINIMIPFKRFLLGLPWPAVIFVALVGAWRIGGWRLGLLVGGLLAFVAATGQWQKAMVTVYLCGVSVVFAGLLGIPIGIWAARSEAGNKIVQVILDTLQTLPAFAYLIPVVMLFRVGDFSAMLAVVAYSIVPAVRYTILGIRQVDPILVEAAQALGCTRRQVLWRVQLPLAVPEIMLGINQTIMMALSMLVITALVGTRDLGQEVYIALTRADIGRGLVAGLCVAFLAITADRLISPWAAKRKARLGITS